MEEGQGRGYVPKDLRFSMVDIRSCVVVESLGGFGGSVRRGVAVVWERRAVW